MRPESALACLEARLVAIRVLAVSFPKLIFVPHSNQMLVGSLVEVKINEFNCALFTNIKVAGVVTADGGGTLFSSLLLLPEFSSPVLKGKMLPKSVPSSFSATARK